MTGITECFLQTAPRSVDRYGQKAGPKPFAAKKKEGWAGFSLIENLVTLLILSFGLLGVASMLAMSMRTHQISRSHSTAVILAQGLADRIRANPEAAAQGMYRYEVAGALAASEQADCLSVSGCDPQSLAAHDLWEWSSMLASSLPAGKAWVCIDSTPSWTAADYYGDPLSVIPGTCDGNGQNYAIHIVWDMDAERDGELLLSSNPRQTDGHLLVALQGDT